MQLFCFLFQWELFKTTQRHTSTIYFPFYECHTFTTFLHHVRDIFTGGIVCTGAYGRMVRPYLLNFMLRGQNPRKFGQVGWFENINNIRKSTKIYSRELFSTIALTFFLLYVLKSCLYELSISMRNYAKPYKHHISIL